MASFDQVVNNKAIAIGKLAVQATTAANSGHPTTALSLAHLVTVLMYHTMRWNPADPADRGADRLVLSEGHAVPIIYAACADLGVTFYPNGKAKKMTPEDALTLRDIHSAIDGHPNPVLGFPFFDAATGSLGQGLSVAAGLGGAARIDKIDKMIYCIIGDGESREGQIWEAMDFIADMKLTNVVAIFNCNKLGQSDWVAPAQSAETVKKKAEAFGWNTLMINGHNPSEINQALSQRGKTADGRPLCIVAQTEKGWGAASLHGMGHHGTPVEKDQLNAVLADLDKTAAGLGAADVSAADIAATLKIQPPPKVAAKPTAGKPASFEQALADGKLTETVASKKKLSPRRAFGIALKALGASNPNVVALDADVKNSTYSIDFAKAYADRFFECRIAEQNMVTAAAGMSSGGKIPFASTFGKFLMRACDQIEMAIIGGSDLKLVGTHIGVTLAADGPSQMAVADVAFARSMAHVKDHRGNPALTTLTPSDAVSTYALVLQMAEFTSACYLRAARADLPLLYPPTETFPFGGHKVLRRPSGKGGKKITLVGVGYMVHSCLAVADQLAKEGIDASVIDCYSLPMDTQSVFAHAKESGNVILSVEDNYVGGVGSELAEAAAEDKNAPTVHSLTVERIAKSGRTPDDVLAYVALSHADIISAAKKHAAG